MNLVKLIDFLRDRLRLVIWVSLGLLAGLLVLDTVLSLTAHHPAAAEHAAKAVEHSQAATAAGEHAVKAVTTAHGAPSEAAHAAKEGFLQSLYHIAETVPMFWALFGFISCVLIVFVSKAYGHMKVGNTEIMTREDYYNE